MTCFRDNITPVVINTQMELRILKTDGWITEDNKLAEKAINLLEEVESTFNVKSKKQKGIVIGADFSVNIAKYRELFPKGTLPSGVPSRVNIKELEKKFMWFFNNYNFSWETVFEATRAYIEHYENQGFKFMQNSSYFISKQDNNKVLTSTLSTWCDQVLEELVSDTVSTKPNIV